MKRLNLIDEAPCESGRDFPLGIGSMLVGKIRRDSRPGTGRGTGTKDEGAGERWDSSA